MNSMANVFLFQQNAHQVLPGTQQTAVLQLQIPAQQVHITMVSSVFHINHAIREESGTIPSVNVSALQDHSQMVSNVSDVELVNFMPMEAAIVQLEHSLMESNVLLRLSINVLELPILTGMELTVFASQVSQLLETHAIVMVSLWVTIVKDAPPNQTQSSPMESVNVTTAMLSLTVFVPSRLLLLSNVMLAPTLTVNSKNVFHVLMDV